jgi:hypothetical protein
MFEWWHNLGLSEPVITLRETLLEDEWEASLANGLVPNPFYRSCELKSSKHKLILSFDQGSNYFQQRIDGFPWMTAREAKVIYKLAVKRWDGLRKAEKDAKHKQQRAEFAKKIGAPSGLV